MTFIITTFLFVLALLLAELEVQIEGSAGWAEKLPTWRAKDDKWYSRGFQKMLSNKPMTGYHLAMFGFVFLILHSHFFWNLSWSFREELIVLSYFFLFAVGWDFLWFVLNPFYALRKFDGQHIWWHKKWWWIFPREYYLGILMSFIVYFIASRLFALSLLTWLMNFGLWIGLTLVVVMIYLIVTKDKIKDL